jgi:NAD(P)-dependent dehydrogenase (short-subunit alcohol dehydrogenase family)
LRLVDAAISVFDGLDILVNNVGAVRPRTGGFLSVSDDDWTWALITNFLAAVRVTRAAVPLLLERGGRIVTTRSVNAFLPDPSVIDYSAAKAALTNFCKALSKEVGPRGHSGRHRQPGAVATALWLGHDGVAANVARASGARPDAVAKQAADETLTGRFTQPQEVADLILLMASDRAGNVTGADFVIDGGLITTHDAQPGHLAKPLHPRSPAARKSGGMTMGIWDPRNRMGLADTEARPVAVSFVITEHFIL